jgi:hypothetical protein
MSLRFTFLLNIFSDGGEMKKEKVKVKATV